MTDTKTPDTYNYVISLDQGTTSCRAIIYDKYGKVISSAQKDITQYYPKEGWVEHDGAEIWGTQSGVLREALETSGVRPGEVAAIGIANQRETTIIWDKNTGRPIHNAIVWQDQRTTDICDELEERGLTDYIKNNCGLVIDSYFSATKIKWLLDNIKGTREKAKNGELLFGTIDTWLIWNLTRGEVHVTDYSNASRTMLFNIHTLNWDDKLLKELNIPKEILPQVRASSEIYGYTDPNMLGGAGIPIAGAAGDQQAALFGQGCLDKGMVKNTYGTGCFLLMNTGQKPIISNNGLLTTIAWGRNGEINYALEGSIFIAGAAVQWLRDNLKLIESAPESEELAEKAFSSSKNNDNDNMEEIYFVPAFQGLGAPYWDMYARGAIFGLTRKAGKAELVKATLESMGYQTRDVVDAMAEDSNLELKTLRADGGASENNFLLQFQADILGIPVERPDDIETTARGAAYLAGLAVCFWTEADINEGPEIDKSFHPELNNEKREKKYKGWQKAVTRTMGWAK